MNDIASNLLANSNLFCEIYVTGEKMRLQGGGVLDVNLGSNLELFYSQKNPPQAVEQ
jgi:hypothetical protein